VPQRCVPACAVALLPADLFLNHFLRRWLLLCKMCANSLLAIMDWIHACPLSAPLLTDALFKQLVDEQSRWECQPDKSGQTHPTHRKLDSGLEHQCGLFVGMQYLNKRMDNRFSSTNKSTMVCWFIQLYFHTRRVYINFGTKLYLRAATHVRTSILRSSSICTVYSTSYCTTYITGSKKYVRTAPLALTHSTTLSPAAALALWPCEAISLYHSVIVCCEVLFF